MNLKKLSVIVCVLSLLIVSAVLARRADLTPDAVTRATTWNSYEGELSFLTDSETPENNPNAGVFTWPEKGIIVMEFPQATHIGQVRIYTGDNASSLQIGVYLGGRRMDDGGGRDPEGEQKFFHTFTDVGANEWFSHVFTEALEADNLEIHCSGRTDIYEIEINSPEGIGVESTIWSNVKKMFE